MATRKTVRRLAHIRNIVFITLVLYAAALILMNTSYLTGDNIKRFFFNAKSEIDDSVPLGNITELKDSNAECVIFKDGFAVIDSKVLSVYSSRFYKYSEHKLPFADPVIRTSDRYIICYDRAESKIYVFDSFNPVYSGSASGNIINAAVSDEGYIAVVTENENYKGILTVYNDDFKEIFKWKSADGYILDTLFVTGKTVAAVTVQAENEKISTCVRIFDFLKAEQKSEIYSSDTLPLSVCLKDDGTIETITQSGVVSFRSSAVNKIYEFGDRDEGLFCQSGKYDMFAFTDGDNTIVTAIDNNGNRLFSVSLTGVHAICCAEEMFLVADSEFLRIYDKTGKEITRFEMSGDTDRIKASSKSVFLYGTDSLEIIDISDIIK